MMACDGIILKLKSMSSEKYKANVVKMGIPESNSIGVSTGDIRKLAKEIKKSNEFAYELWRTGYLKLISEHSNDECEHVKKAISWAFGHVKEKNNLILRRKVKCFQIKN